MNLCETNVLVENANHTMRPHVITPSTKLAGLFLFWAGVSGAAVPTVAAATQEPAPRLTPSLSVGAAEFPDEDAIIIRREQHWTLGKDNALRRREHEWVKLLNSRPIRRFADPRIDYCDGPDKLTIHTAQTILPDATILPVPEYSFNVASPDDVHGWPQYAGWRQMIVSFSGIEDNVVLELDYEVATQAGVVPWIDADLRLDDDYPTLQRIVRVTVPEDVDLHYRVDGMKTGSSPDVQADEGTKTYLWFFADLPGTKPEPQSPPWRRRCGRLRFTTCPDAVQWVSARLQPVEEAGAPAEAVKTFAEAAVKDEPDPGQRVRAVAKKLRDSFHHVASPKTLRGLTCRSAADVLRSNYGNPLESAALLASALRSLGMQAQPAVAVDAEIWDETVPTESAFAGVVVVVDSPDGPVYVHPAEGVFRNPGSWGRHRLLSVAPSGELRNTYVYARGEQDPSELQITGKITVEEDGTAGGELRVRLTGAFYDPASLETAEKQEALVKSLVGRVLSGFKVEKHSVASLSDETFQATAQVASDGALKAYGDQHVLRFADGPAFLSDFALPLERSYRRTNVYVGGRFREHVDLAVTLPEEWQAGVVPASLPAVERPWGMAEQTVEVDGRTVRLRRTVTLTTDTVAPDAFAELRDAVNDLRAPKSLVLTCGKPSAPDLSLTSD